MPTKYGKPELIKDTSDRLKKMEAIKNDPYRFGVIQDKKVFYERERKLREKAKRITPPPVESGREGDKLLKRQKQLVEFMIEPCAEIRKPAMTSYADHWKLRSGVVGQLRAWDERTKNYNLDANGKPVRVKDGYGAVFEWKDNQRMIYDTEEQISDPDLASIETFRPQNSTGTFMDYRRMTFAPGAGVSEERYNEAVGITPEKEAPVDTRRVCSGFKPSTGERCRFWARNGFVTCHHHREQEPKPIQAPPAEPEAPTQEAS